MAKRAIWTVAGIVIGVGVALSPLALTEAPKTTEIEPLPRASEPIQSPKVAIAADTYHPMVSFAPMVEALEPAVVAIEVESLQRGLANNPLLEYFFGLPPEALGPQIIQGEGSGFIISADGLLLTNHHVIARAETIRARFADGEVVGAKLLGSDANMDIALLVLDGKRTWPHVKFGSSKQARVGDWVVAMGNPLGLGHTVTAGIISGKGRILHHDRLFGSDDFIQTDAAINQGNSGGPLFNLSGEVIGMNTAIIQGANTIGFAVPIDPIKEIIKDLQEKGFVSRGYLGVQPQRLTPELAEAVGAKRSDGALIARVYPDSAAKQYGLEAGDIVIGIDDEPIVDPEALIQIVANNRPGTRIEIKVVRNGKTKLLDLVLGERPDHNARRKTVRSPMDAPRVHTLGMELGPMSQALREQTGIHHGIVVESIAKDSPAKDRLKPGDIILAVNQRPVRNAEEVEYALKRSSGSVFFLVARGDVQLFVVVPLD
jgi:serine protease Do